MLRPELWLFLERGLKSTRIGPVARGRMVRWRRPASSQVSLNGPIRHGQDTDRRDRCEKPRAYARTGIPIYLLVDREKGSVVVRSNPVDGEYERILIQPFGAQVPIPDPVASLSIPSR
ncbi:Uma2 family endonuclease [Nocardia caishijiensis]|uniref:Uma2 family endonuclease n=1 Tax=Nocardia caishijiensis TaxID=184756 RepID=UPI001917917C|nr:Uma2 family endonuclease [Nocardia caishijiensis]